MREDLIEVGLFDVLIILRPWNVVRAEENAGAGTGPHKGVTPGRVRVYSWGGGGDRVVVVGGGQVASIHSHAELSHVLLLTANVGDHQLSTPSTPTPSLLVLIM